MTDILPARNTSSQVRSQPNRGQSLPDNERKLRDDLTRATDRIKELIAEINKLQEENDALARIVNVLELENHELRTGTGRTGQLIGLPSAYDR
ncbi:hypothetical protein [Micromonospora rubida]|uniref:hypothetical protein n=1 Tax=Micromonospora rubida TaxID=2697657 RepID=UPI001F34DA0B|nr:hypothetical protein [Micromonospora rubida]